MRLEERSQKVWVKVHHSRTGETVVAACDEQLLGRKLELDNGMSVEVSKAFYGGVLVEKDELDRYLNQATIINLLGDEVVSYAVRKGLAAEKAIIRVGGVLHVQLYL